MGLKSGGFFIRGPTKCLSHQPQRTTPDRRTELGHDNEPFQELTAILMGINNAGFGRNAAVAHLRRDPGSSAEQLRQKWRDEFDSRVLSS